MSSAKYKYFLFSADDTAPKKKEAAAFSQRNTGAIFAPILFKHIHIHIHIHIQGDKLEQMEHLFQSLYII